MGAIPTVLQYVDPGSMPVVAADTLTWWPSHYYVYVPCIHTTHAFNQSCVHSNPFLPISAPTAKPVDVF